MTKGVVGTGDSCVVVVTVATGRGGRRGIIITTASTYIVLAMCPDLLCIYRIFNMYDKPIT